MRSFAGYFGTALACAGLLVACGKSDHSSAATPVSPPAAAAATRAAPALAARTIADRLLAAHFAPDGYGVQQALACNPPGAGDDFAMRCIGFFHDPQRGGQPVVIEVRLYDSDQNFAALVQPLKDHVESMKGRWTVDIQPEVTLTRHDTGAQTRLPVSCHQRLGPANGPAYCAALFTPRIFVTAGVRPAHAGTRELVVGTGGGPSPADEDTDHARELVIAAVTKIGGLF